MPQNPQAGASPDKSYALGRPFAGAQGRFVAETFVDAAGVKQQSTVISIGGATSDSTYTLRVQSTTAGISFDQSYSYLSDGTATANEIRDGLAAALRADATLGLLVSDIDADTSAELTLTGAAGRTFSLTLVANPSTDLSVVTTAPGFSQYLYGQAVEVVAAPAGGASDIDSRGIQDPALPTLATLVLTINANANGETSTIVVGRSYSDGQASSIDTVVVTAGADVAATAAAIEAAFLAKYPASTQQTASNIVTITFPAGEGVDIVSITNTAALDISGATTEPGALTELALVIDSFNVAPIESRTGLTSVTGPVPGTAVTCAKESGSTVWVVAAPGVSLSGTRVYCDASGALYDAAAIDRRPFPAAKWGQILDANTATLEL